MVVRHGAQHKAFGVNSNVDLKTERGPRARHAAHSFELFRPSGRRAEAPKAGTRRDVMIDHQNWPLASRRTRRKLRA
jgi:hypothetical protein